jgi:hypothetical protein
LNSGGNQYLSFYEAPTGNEMWVINISFHVRKK